MKFLSQIVATTVALNLLGTSAFAENYTLEYLQKLAANDAPKVVMPSDINSDHWIFEILKTISEKYGLILGSPEEKFAANKSITRNEVAVVLVSLLGKIEQDSLKLTDIEKDRIRIIKRELSKELQVLTGRVEKLEEADKRSVKFGFAEETIIRGAIVSRYTGNFSKGASSRPSNFSLPIVDFSVAGKIRPHLDYFINTFPSRRFDSTANGLIGDTFISTDIIPNNKIYFGQKRKPYGIEGMQSDYTLEMIDRSQVSRTLGNKRDTGLTIIGNWKFLDYATGVYNGSGINTNDTQNSDQEYGVMATVNPLYAVPDLGTMKFGGTYNQGKQTFTNKLYGIVGNYQTPGKKFLFQGEFLQKDGYLAAKQEGYGWYLHSSYFLTDKLQLLTRFDMFDQNRALSQDIQTEYTLGSNYYFFAHNLKLMTNLIYINNKTGSDSKRVVLQTQYRF